MKKLNYSKYQLTSLVLLRALIGWHFLYEGCVKTLNPLWSARGFLMDSRGFAKPFFEWMAETENILDIVNLVNEWGLILIGFSLIVGLFTRWSAIAGIIMLALFYLSHPPFIGADYLMPSEGSYLIVNKNLIELASLVVLILFPTSKIIGIDRLISFRKASK